jgi:hypothetical protein
LQIHTAEADILAPAKNDVLLGEDSLISSRNRGDKRVGCWWYTSASKHDLVRGIQNETSGIEKLTIILYTIGSIIV